MQATAHDHHHYCRVAAGVSVTGLTRDRLIKIETSILARNDSTAQANRRGLNAHGVLTLKLVSSPGSGKAIQALVHVPLAEIEGDQQTSADADADADRIRATRARAIRINTGTGSHLDAQMVGHAIDRLRPRPSSYLFVETVGNRVCPAGFDLGEDAKVAFLSVTKGEEKPRKHLTCSPLRDWRS